jgi:hypothetical protein
MNEGNMRYEGYPDSGFNQSEDFKIKRKTIYPFAKKFTTLKKIDFFYFGFSIGDFELSSPLPPESAEAPFSSKVRSWRLRRGFQSLLGNHVQRLHLRGLSRSPPTNTG